MERGFTEKGASALFVVIFSAILLSVVATSFVTLVNRDMVQSRDTELSQGAYDAALAGVEDAKRVVASCLNGDTSACGALDSNRCDTVFSSGVIPSSNADETLVRSIGGVGGDVNQAYTCVKANLNSTDVLHEVTPGASVFVPLRASGSIKRITIEWQKQGDGSIADTLSSGHMSSCLADQLCSQATWGNVPAMLRTQLILPGNSVSLSDLDTSSKGGTAFLYPRVQNLGATTISQSLLSRYTSSASGDALQYVGSCSNSRYIIGYACIATLELTNSIPANSDLNIMRLTSIYHNASIRVTLSDNAGNALQFRAVQPVVDATGRADDVFRRVEARLSTLSNAIEPAGEIDLVGPAGESGSLCKNFYVTNDSAGLNGATNCTP